MKRRLAILCALALLAVAVVTAVCLFTLTATRCDFHYRLAEVDCVRQSVDPFRVWNEDVTVRPYYSNNPNRRSIPEGCTEMISVYVPWEYTLMLPFAWLGKETAWWAYLLLSFAALGLLVGVVFHETKRRMPLAEATLCATVPLMAVAYAIWSNFQVGNHMALVLTAAVLMASCLNRKREVAAGFCWAVMMIKPQIGLAFAIPLLLRARVVTVVVAVGVCLLLSVYPAVNCQTSLLDLILEPSRASAFAFEGCGTWPRFLCGAIPSDGDILAGLVVGAVVCAALTALVRRERDWFVFLMPAAITSCCWTYTQAYSHAMGWFVAFVLVRALLRHPQSRFLWALAALAACSLSRGFLAWHGLVAFAGWTFPLSDYAFRCWDSLNSTLSLGLAAAQCVWLWQTGPCPSGAAGRALGDSPHGDQDDN